MYIYATCIYITHKCSRRRLATPHALRLKSSHGQQRPQPPLISMYIIHTYILSIYTHTYIYMLCSYIFHTQAQ